MFSEVVQHGDPAPTYLPPTKGHPATRSWLEKQCTEKKLWVQVISTPNFTLQDISKTTQGRQVTYAWGSPQHPTALLAQFKQHQHWGKRKGDSEGAVIRKIWDRSPYYPSVLRLNQPPTL